MMPNKTALPANSVAKSQVLDPTKSPPPNSGPSRPNLTTSGPNATPPAPAANNLLAALPRTKRGSWRWQTAVFCWLVLVVSLAGLLASLYVVSDRVQTFQEIEQVAVPSINAANQAEQSLSAEVSANASYILSDANTRQTLLTQIERDRADFESALETGYSSLASANTANPSVAAASDYLNQHNQALQDAFALARGQADNNDQKSATTTYLKGRDTYYNPIIYTIYYLRSIYINQLNQAKDAASSANILQLVLVILIVIATVGLLLLVSLWLTLKIKRVFVPLVNIGFLIAAGYAIFLVVSLVNSSGNLNRVVSAYSQTSLLSDSQRILTDAASDQTQWLIAKSGGVNGFDIYAQDFKTQTGHLLVVPSNPSDGQCPSSNAGRASYQPTGEMGDVCRSLLSDNQVDAWNNFYNAYTAWLQADTQFRSTANGNATNATTNALAFLNSSNVTQSFSNMSSNLNQLKTANTQIYANNSNDALNQLNLATILTWAVYPIVLILGIAGLLRWRREF